MKIAAAVVLVVLAAGCSTGSGTGHELDGLCKFASPALTNGAAARQMAADIQAAIPATTPANPRDLKIKTAAFKLMVSAGSAVPTGQEDQAANDLSLEVAVKAQADLATACA
ncbi:MAG: hypothetical protein JWN31_1222 [Frankiales bacterium]|nr:hypothetical protein [Frankiales bacterium]